VPQLGQLRDPDGGGTGGEGPTGAPRLAPQLSQKASPATTGRPHTGQTAIQPHPLLMSGAFFIIVVHAARLAQNRLSRQLPFTRMSSLVL
jgi:hypothetical protein